MSFSRSGRQIIQPEQKNQIAAEQLASMASARANRMRRKLELEAPQLLEQLQGNPQLQQQLLTTIQIKDDYDDFVALLNQMKQMNINSGSGSIGSGMDTGSSGGRKRRRTKRRRTLRRRMTKRRRY